MNTGLPIRALALGLWLVACTHAAAESSAAPAPATRAGSPREVQCGSPVGTGTQSAALKRSFIEALAQVFWTSSPGSCMSLRTVLNAVMTNTRAGARELKSGGFNRQAAQAELAEARADDSFRRDLAMEIAGEADPVRQMVIEAGVLDSHGFYGARDLLISNLIDAGK